MVEGVDFLPNAAGRPRVLIDCDADWERARVLIGEFEARRREPIEGVRNCPKCGEENPSNFELCWSCRSDLGGPGAM
jgi:hypothetical protein